MKARMNRSPWPWPDSALSSQASNELCVTSSLYTPSKRKTLKSTRLRQMRRWVASNTERKASISRSRASR
jgi:hypothetical protein